MKKFLPLFFVGTFMILLSSSVMAQVRFGAKAGFNAAKVGYRQFPGLSPKMTPSFQAGGVAEFALPVDVLYLNVGLEWQGKGYQYVTDSADYTLNATVNPMYIQVPISLNVKAEDGGMFAAIGTYFAYGITGKVDQVVKIKADNNKTTTSDNVRFGSTTQDHFKPFDFGATIEVGYETESGLRFTGAYSWGLGDARKDAYKETKIISPVNHRVASICLTYFFKTIK